jgi:hypothetical protein
MQALIGLVHEHTAVLRAETCLGPQDCVNCCAQGPLLCLGPKHQHTAVLRLPHVTAAVGIGLFLLYFIHGMKESSCYIFTPASAYKSMYALIHQRLHSAMCSMSACLVIAERG